MIEESGMAKTLEQVMAELSPKRRKRIEARAAQLIAEERSLRDLRQAQRLTQQSMAKRLGVRQHSISRLEQRSDMLLSTLRDYVGKMGGKIVITAHFPDRPPVRISGFADIAEPSRTKRPRQPPAAARRGKVASTTSRSR
jgi:DNA-binding XRE family transcriptional regulator